jgi:hypothetical protein
MAPICTLASSDSFVEFWMIPHGVFKWHFAEKKAYFTIFLQNLIFYSMIYASGMFVSQRDALASDFNRMCHL